MKRVLVTGDAGFVGRHFHQALDGERHDVTGVDLKSGSDARDFFRRSDERFDLVVHLAAVVGGRLTIERDPMAVATDLAIDADLWQWALRTRPGRVVYYSSSAAYPAHLQARGIHMRLRESYVDLDDVRSPDLTYGWAKLTGEYQARFVEAGGVRVHVFRPFSGYGADQDLAYPWPSFLDRARRRQDPFVVWGDGTQVRDFIHVDDVVAATLACVAADVPGPVNLCSGEATSFNDLAAMAAAARGYEPRVLHLEDKPSGVHHRVGDPAKMLEAYRPAMTLERAFEEALAVV